MDLSTALKQLRNELNMTQQDLADMLQTNVSTVNRWEQRKNKPMRAMSLLIMKIAEEKGVSEVYLNNLKENLLPREDIKAGINDLRHAEIDRINQLLNNSANGVVVFGIESHDILYANNKALQFVGCSFEDGKKMKCYEFYMKNEVEFFPHHYEDYPQSFLEEGLVPEEFIERYKK